MRYSLHRINQPGDRRQQQEMKMTTAKIMAGQNRSKPLCLEFGYCDREYVAVAKPGEKAVAKAIYRAANDEGTIQAEDMLEMFPGQPTLHTASSIYRAFRAAGIEVREKRRSKTDWARVDAQRDEDIDLSDNPEVTPEMFAKARARQS
jgi:hypothetical protein